MQFLDQEIKNRISFWLVIISTPIIVLLLIRKSFSIEMPLLIWVLVNLIFIVWYNPHYLAFAPVEDGGEMGGFLGFWTAMTLGLAIILSGLITSYNTPSKWWSKSEYKSRTITTPVTIQKISKLDDTYEMSFINTETSEIETRDLTEDEYTILKAQKKENLKCIKKTLIVNSKWRLMENNFSVFICKTSHKKFLIK